MLLLRFTCHLSALRRLVKRTHFKNICLKSQFAVAAQNQVNQYRPLQKTIYEKSKRTVKKWENEFRKNNGRVPSKLDIKEASSEIRYAYKTYFNLKTCFLEQSLTDIVELGELETLEVSQNSQNIEPSPPEVTENETKVSEIPKTPDPTTEVSFDVWGEHLNRNRSRKNSNPKKLTLSLSLSQESFIKSGPKFSKRNPRKSLKKENSMNSSQITCSQPLCEKILNDVNDMQVFQSSSQPFEITNVSPPTTGNRKEMINIVKRMVDVDGPLVRRQVNTDWMERVSKTIDVNPSQKDSGNFIIDSDGDSIVENSDVEEEYGHASKKMRFSLVLTEEKTSFVNSFATGLTAEYGEFKVKPIPSKTNGNKNHVEELKTDNTFGNTTLDFDNEVHTNSLVNEQVATKTRDVIADEPKLQKLNENDEFKFTNDDDEPPVQKKQRRKAKQNEKLDDDSQSKTSKKVKPKKMTGKKNLVPKNTVAKDINGVDISEINGLADGCFKLKKKTITNISSESNKVEKLENKIKTGALNDNFVRIDIQKKTYVRGKKNFNFSKHKKTQWKAKKKELSGSTTNNIDSLNCFKCGKSGHFARQCPVVEDDGLLPLDAQFDEINRPQTLEEAAKKVQQLENNDDNTDKSDLQIPIQPIEMPDENDLNDADFNAIDIELKRLDCVQPIYKLNDDGTLMHTPEEVFQALKEEFGHEAFRRGQEKTIMRILSGQSTLLTLSTGSGKSLCYQLPAYLYSKHRSPCVALIISPLVSLMQDQVSRSSRTACLNSAMSLTMRSKIVDSLQAGELDSLLVSPEAIVNGIHYLARILPPISFICIDEVHCISQWSHNFRPSYLLLCKVLRSKLNASVMLGLTATASKEVQQNITRHLNISEKSIDNGIIGEISIPSNLTLNASCEENKDAALITLLNSDRFKDYKSIIIYCTRQQECERLAGLLRTAIRIPIEMTEAKALAEVTRKRKRRNADIVVEVYHAGLGASRRKTIQKRFMSGELKIVVATVAFGMGIDKSDIRSVVHYNMPKNFESYVQEIGRAGRDNKNAYCHVFLDRFGSDRKELKRHIFCNSIDRYVIRKLLQKVFKSCNCSPGNCTRHEVSFNVDETVTHLNVNDVTITTLLCYLELREPESYLEVLKMTYDRCRIVSYQGVEVLENIARTSGILAEALKLVSKHKKGEEKLSNIIEFSITDVARNLNLESYLVKYKLKDLEWTSVNNVKRRTSIRVDFHSLAFHIRSRGDLTEEQLDNTLNYLYSHVINKENKELQRLEQNYRIFMNIAKNNNRAHENMIMETSEKLKQKILTYFNLSEVLFIDELECNQAEKPSDATIMSSIQSLLFIYKEHTFTGRDVANILYGIPTPNFPAVVWTKCRFWRLYVGEDFHRLSRLASNVLLSFKCI